MIFTKVEASLIRRGKKSALLAPAHKDDLTGRYRPPGRYRIGADLAVQPGAGLDETCRILINGLTLRTLGELDFVTARALGFRTQAEMAADWMDRHDDHWPLLEEALCDRCDGHAQVDNEVCPDCEIGVIEVPAQLPDEQTLRIFRTKHGDKPVWLVTFELPAELPRYLASHSERGYTTRTFDALPSEAEAIDEVTQKRFSKRAQASHEEREREDFERKVTSTCVAFKVDPTDARARATVRNGILSAQRRSA